MIPIDADAPPIRAARMRSATEIADLACHHILDGVEAMRDGSVSYRHTFHYLLRGSRVNLRVAVSDEDHERVATVRTSCSHLELALGLTAVRLAQRVPTEVTVGNRTLRASLPPGFAPDAMRLFPRPHPDVPAPEGDADIKAEEVLEKTFTVGLATTLKTGGFQSNPVYTDPVYGVVGLDMGMSVTHQKHPAFPGQPLIWVGIRLGAAGMLNNDLDLVDYAEFVRRHQLVETTDANSESGWRSFLTPHPDAA